MAEKKTKAPAKKAMPAGRQAAVKKATKTATKKAAPTVEKKSKPAEIKTKETTASVVDFINSVDDEQKRKDSFTIIEMMKKATGAEPKMWGSAIIGFGNRKYKSPATGREVDWMVIGFSPRKAYISLYIAMNINIHADTLKRLGKHKTGKGCLYINKLADIDTTVLKEMIDTSLKQKD